MRQRKCLPIHEAASRSHVRVRSTHEVFDLLESGGVELRFVTTNGRQLLFHRIGDVDDELAMPDALFGIERKWSINQVRHSIGDSSFEAIIPLGELRIKA